MNFMSACLYDIHLQIYHSAIYLHCFLRLIMSTQMSSYPDSHINPQMEYDLSASQTEVPSILILRSLRTPEEKVVFMTNPQI
jgi:hypothetical protein